MRSAFDGNQFLARRDQFERAFQFSDGTERVPGPADEEHREFEGWGSAPSSTGLAFPEDAADKTTAANPPPAWVPTQPACSPAVRRTSCRPETPGLRTAPSSASPPAANRPGRSWRRQERAHLADAAVDTVDRSAAPSLRTRQTSPPEQPAAERRSCHPLHA